MRAAVDGDCFVLEGSLNTKFKMVDVGHRGGVRRSSLTMEKTPLLLRP